MGCEESGSFDLPFYVEALSDLIGQPELVICLDAECGNYEQLWVTTSLLIWPTIEVEPGVRHCQCISVPWNAAIVGSGSVNAGPPAQGKADLTISVKDADFMSMQAGKLNPQSAFMSGKIKIKGNMGLAMKLGTVLNAAKAQANL